MVKFLIIGRGAMALLHASFLQSSSPEAEFAFLDQPGASLSLQLGVVPAGSEVVPLQSASVDISQAVAFIDSSTAVLVCVKCHQIQTALEPIKTKLATAAVVVLLHNGLPSPATSAFLDRELPACCSMVTSAGATLLLAEEIVEPYSIVSRATGPGASFVFPRSPSVSSSSVPAELDALISGIPSCSLLSHSEGSTEQLLKLAVNIALNGTLAYMALKPWKEANQDESQLRRVVNREMAPLLPLARNVAKLVLLRASAAGAFGNPSLLAAASSGLAGERTALTLESVPTNVCSTVVDINSGRRTERGALLDQVLAWGAAEGESSEARDHLLEMNELLREWDFSRETGSPPNT